MPRLRTFGFGASAVSLTLWVVRVLDWWARAEFAVQKAQWLAKLMPLYIPWPIWLEPVLLILGVALIWLSGERGKVGRPTEQPTEQPTSLPHKTRVTLVSALKPYDKKAVVHLSYAAESHAQAAYLLTDVFSAAGWEVSRDPYPLDGDNPQVYIYGTEVTGRDPRVTKLVATALEGAGYPGVRQTEHRGPQDPKLNKPLKLIYVTLGHPPP